MSCLSLNVIDSNYVPDSREHIDSTPIICSHKVGTLQAEPIQWIIYTKGSTVFRMDNFYNFHYKDRTFKLENGKLIVDGQFIVLPTRTDISTVARLVLSLGLAVSTTDTDPTFNIEELDAKSLLSAFTMLALKDMGIIPNSFTLNKQRKYGEVVFGVYLKSVIGTGEIKATNQYMRWLNEEDTLQLKARLFKTTDHRSYQVGIHSMKYAPTELADNIFTIALDLLLAVDFEKNNIEFQSLDFCVPMELLKTIRLRDVMLLLNDCIGYNNGFIIRPQPIDEQYSRVYSVFTFISSSTRKLLGFTNYDIGSALQTICLQLVKDASLYPLHQELMNDKHRFREKVMLESGNDMDWVKEELTSADNRERMLNSYNTIPMLKSYFEEALILRKEIINTAEAMILDRAEAFAKPNWRKEWDSVKKEFIFHEDGKKESSVFFFIWTQWERQIREAMMTCFDDPSACHQVHDAVYSKQIVDPSVIEAAVLEQTGFRVQISVDHPSTT